jgi:hypothetical protein
VTSPDTFELLVRRNPVTAAMRDELAAQAEALRPQLPPLAPLPQQRRSLSGVRLISAVGTLLVVLHRHPWRSSRSALLLATSVVVTALVAITVASPWRGGPTILERAAAAVPAPTPGQILYESIELRFKGHPLTHIHIGLAGTPPHRFRVTSNGIPQADVGGTVGASAAQRYEISTGELISVDLRFPVSQSDVDPVSFIRAALTSGQARLDGKTRIRGRDVLRIRVNSSPFGHSVPTALYYVDAHSYRPVRVVFPPGVFTGPSLRGLAPIFILFLGYGGRPDVLGFHYALIFDFVEFRYLAPTADDRKLTNIQAAHPHARIP